jgi:ribonuclease R
MAVLRTLTKAEYSPALIGHFALASEAYAHFTSPIRRYADLTVHRALGEYLRQTDNGEDRPRDEHGKRALGKRLRDTPACPDEGELMRIARHCTVREQNAEDAERELRQFLVLQLLEKHIGEVFQGVITGVTQRGVFVQLDKYLADGMVAKEDLPGDVTRDNRRPLWKLDKRTGALVDQNSGRAWAMGDTVEVTIAKIDLARRQMDLTIASAESRAAGKAKKTPELTLGGAGGGLGHAEGEGFKGKSGAQRRSQKSKSRDKQKKDFRKERKDKRR